MSLIKFNWSQPCPVSNSLLSWYEHAEQSVLMLIISAGNHCPGYLAGVLHRDLATRQLLRPRGRQPLARAAHPGAAGHQGPGAIARVPGARQARLRATQVGARYWGCVREISSGAFGTCNACDALSMTGRGRCCRFMSVNTAVQQLLEVEASCQGGAYGEDTMCVGLARVGADEQKVCVLPYALSKCRYVQ
jgi:hypothetical protein